jgi:hypothetical protein
VLGSRRHQLPPRGAKPLVLGVVVALTLGSLAVVARQPAWTAYDPVAVGTRLGGSLRQPDSERTQANKDKAVSFAAYLALVDLFPARRAVFEDRMATLGYATDGSDTSTAATVAARALERVRPVVSRRDANTIDKDARMFFALNNALLDASITAWDGKRNWDSVRPITAVRWLMRGKIIQAWGGPYKGPSYIKGGDWIPSSPRLIRRRRSPSTPLANPPSAARRLRS